MLGGLDCFWIFENLFVFYDSFVDNFVGISVDVIDF